MSNQVNLTTEELAARERVPVSTVHVWNYRKTGPPRFRAGRRVLYRLADVEAWEAARVVESGRPGA